MKTKKILLTVLILLIAILPVISQSQFNIKDKRRVVLRFNPEDSILPKLFGMILNLELKKIVGPLIQTNGITSGDSIVFSFIENQELCKILESYGDTIIATFSKNGEQLPVFIQMTFKNGKLSFKEDATAKFPNKSTANPNLLFFNNG